MFDRITGGTTVSIYDLLVNRAERNWKPDYPEIQFREGVYHTQASHIIIVGYLYKLPTWGRRQSRPLSKLATSCQHSPRQIRKKMSKKKTRGKYSKAQLLSRSQVRLSRIQYAQSAKTSRRFIYVYYSAFSKVTKTSLYTMFYFIWWITIGDRKIAHPNKWMLGKFVFIRET